MAHHVNQNPCQSLTQQNQSLSRWLGIRTTLSGSNFEMDPKRSTTAAETETPKTRPKSSTPRVLNLV
jgi:hypothetical protein